MNGRTHTGSPAVTAMRSHGATLDSVLDKVRRLDDDELRALSLALDGDLAGALSGPIDDATADLVTVAAAVRILARRRANAAGRRRAADRIRDLMTVPESP